MHSIITFMVMALLLITDTFAAPAPASLGAPSTTGTCSDTNIRCVGDITYWNGGLGACGWSVDTANQNVIALPFGFMGTQSNGNPFCGKSLTIYNPATGNTAQATVGDKCMGCTGRSIDLTEKLFNQLTNNNMAAGREYNVQWWFN